MYTVYIIIMDRYFIYAFCPEQFIRFLWPLEKGVSSIRFFRLTFIKFNVFYAIKLAHSLYNPIESEDVLPYLPPTVEEECYGSRP